VTPTHSPLNSRGLSSGPDPAGALPMLAGHRSTFINEAGRANGRTVAGCETAQRPMRRIVQKSEARPGWIRYAYGSVK